MKRKYLQMRPWCAANGSLHVQVRPSVVIVGTTTERMGTEGRYFATSLAVRPPRVSTMMRGAPTLMAVLTAEEARLSNGLMGIGADFTKLSKIDL